MELSSKFIAGETLQIMMKLKSTNIQAINLSNWVYGIYIQTLPITT